MINESTVIKYLDLVFLNIDDVSNFNVYEILRDLPDFGKDEVYKSFSEWHYELTVKIRGFSFAHEYFKPIDNNPNVRLTNKGIKARDLGGHNKYIEHSKKDPLTKYQKIYLPFFILFGLFGIYKVFQPSVSISDFQKLKNDFGLLKSDFDSLNPKLNPIVKQISQPTLEQLNDTLQTNNSNKNNSIDN